MNWATQIAARVAKSASSVIRWEAPPVLQPPHAKPVTIAMTAPRIRPQTPYLTLPAGSGSIDNASLKCGDLITSYTVTVYDNAPTATRRAAPTISGFADIRALEAGPKLRASNGYFTEAQSPWALMLAS